MSTSGFRSPCLLKGLRVRFLFILTLSLLLIPPSIRADNPPGTSDCPKCKEHVKRKVRALIKERDELKEEKRWRDKEEKEEEKEDKGSSFDLGFYAFSLASLGVTLAAMSGCMGMAAGHSDGEKVYNKTYGLMPEELSGPYLVRQKKQKIGKSLGAFKFLAAPYMAGYSWVVNDFVNKHNSLVDVVQTTGKGIEKGSDMVSKGVNKVKGWFSSEDQK